MPVSNTQRNKPQNNEPEGNRPAGNERPANDCAGPGANRPLKTGRYSTVRDTGPVNGKPQDRTMKIYTKTGDSGDTSLFGGERVPKNNGRIEAYGTVDELNATVGMARSHGPAGDVDRLLEQIQKELFVLGADLATPPSRKTRIDRIAPSHVESLENQIDAFGNSLEPLRYFILPGGNPAAAALHMCRTQCRRGERICIAVRTQESLSEDIVKYLNRLSDLFFVLARYENSVTGIGDNTWISDES